jgi:hypothetical protein
MFDQIRILSKYHLGVKISLGELPTREKEHVLILKLLNDLVGR